MNLRESRHYHGSHTVSGPVAYNVRHIRRPIQIQWTRSTLKPRGNAANSTVASAQQWRYAQRNTAACAAWRARPDTHRAHSQALAPARAAARKRSPREAPRARVHARKSTLARRSRRRDRRPRRSAACGPLACRPGRTACRSRGTWVRGETQRAAPMPTAIRYRQWDKARIG